MMLVNPSSHNGGERSVPWDYVSAESKATFPGGCYRQGESIDGGGGGEKKKEEKKKLKKSIDEGVDWLAGSQDCISQVTHTQAGSFPRGYSHCKVLLRMTEGAGTKETKDDSLKAGSPGSLLVSWQDNFSE